MQRCKRSSKVRSEQVSHVCVWSFHYRLTISFERYALFFPESSQRYSPAKKEEMDR